MNVGERIKQLRSRLARGRSAIRRIVAFNTRRRRAIKRLSEQLGGTVMFDSVDVGQIPARAPAVAGYTAGRWPTYWELVKRFPHAAVLSIAIAASYDATCLDIEAGDATPAEAPAWVRRQIARGVKRPVVYCSVSSMDALLGKLERAGIKREQVRVWTAHYTFAPHLCGPHSCGALRSTIADATQWTDQALGRNLDQSLVAAGFTA
ncbi:MAG TPA: hypothetical protein VNY83_04935 [Solirubrobacterales bacterium]|jgi:hypothetical protein|nr:hypothetical protein [Solirubrobacterales bacterium]